jgi:hypothetical protein
VARVFVTPLGTLFKVGFVCLLIGFGTGLYLGVQLAIG